MGNGVARVSPDPLDRPRITRSKSDGLRPHSIGRTSRRTPRVNRTDSHSESPRPLSHGRISPAFGRPTPIQPFPNPDMDGINRHSTTNQPPFVSNPRTIPTQPSHIRDSPNPTMLSCMALARPSTASAVASLPTPPATRRRSPSCWQRCRERRRRREAQTPCKMGLSRGLSLKFLPFGLCI